MAKSNLQKYKYCYNCCTTFNLESHHCIHGTANRKVAERFGLCVWLCHTCHMGLHDKNTELDKALQIKAQKYFEENIGTRAEFRKAFGKSFL